TEARPHRIAGQVAQVLEAPGPDVEQRQQHQGDPGAAVVAAESRERLAQPGAQLDPAQIPPEQFQAAVRRERLRHELDGEITLDHSPQGRYRQAHQRGLQWLRGVLWLPSLETALESLLIHFCRSFPAPLIREWG